MSFLFFNTDIPTFSPFNANITTPTINRNRSIGLQTLHNKIRVGTTKIKSHYRVWIVVGHPFVIEYEVGNLKEAGRDGRKLEVAYFMSTYNSAQPKMSSLSTREKCVCH